MPSQPENAVKKHSSITIWYTFAALIWCLPSLILTGYCLPVAITGNLGAGELLAAVHAILLGVLLTAACGVLWQFVPIAFQAQPLPRHLLYWHLPLHTLSVLTMVIGFILGKFPIVAWGGTCLLVVTMAYGRFLVASLRKARNKTPIFAQLGLPVLLLPVVMITGILMATGIIEGTPEWLATHAMIGLLGFWATLVMVLSYKFFPMFALSHGYTVTPHRVVRIFLIGLALLVTGVWSGAPSTVNRDVLSWVGVLGGLLALIAQAIFVRDSFRIVRARKRKRIAPALLSAFAATAILLGASMSGIVALAFHLASEVVAIAYLFLVGGLIPLLLSYLHKIIPFLRFEYRFSHAPDRRTAPALDDMVQRVPFAMGMGIYGGASLLSWLWICISVSSVHVYALWLGLLLGVIQALGVAIVGWGLMRTASIGGPRPC